MSLETSLLTFNAVLFLNVCSTFNCLLIAVVPDGNVGTRLGESLCHSQANAGTCTRDDGSLALVGKEGHDLVLLGGSGVPVGKEPVMHCGVGHIG